jgi:outer membrane protein
MKKTLILALALGAPAVAQEAAKADASPRIAVIDMDRISRDSLLGKEYASRLDGLNNEIEAERTKKRNDLQKLENEVKGLQDELEKQATVLSEEAAERKRAEIIKKTRERDAFLEDGRAELERMQQRAQNQAQILNNEFQQKIRPQIEAAAKEKGVDVLLDGRYALTINAAFDISQSVIVKMDDAERANKSGAAKPAAKPAAAKPSPATK